MESVGPAWVVRQAIQFILRLCLSSESTSHYPPASQTPTLEKPQRGSELNESGPNLSVRRLLFTQPGVESVDIPTI